MRRIAPLAFGLLLLLGACQADTTPGALPAIDQPASFVVLGDFGDGSDSQYEVAAAVARSVAKRSIDALITTGDNFYTDDADLVWNRPYGWLADAQIPVIAAWGNHDVESSRRVRLVEETLAPPGRWFSGPLGSGRLIVLDSTRISDPAQTHWLETELAAAHAPIVVVFHHPAFSCGFHGSTGSIQDKWVPLFDRYEVDLVLNGHEHDYERFESEKTTYVVTGGGGRSLRNLEQCPAGTPQPSFANDTDHHLVRLDVTSSHIEGVVMTVGGKSIDEFEVDY